MLFNRLVLQPRRPQETDMSSEGNISSSAPAMVRATVVQAATVFHDTPATLDKAEKLIAEAAELGSQLVVFPEAFVGGQPRGTNFAEWLTKGGKEKFLKYHASAIDIPGLEMDRMAAMARKYGVYLVMGVIERNGYTLYCTVVFFDPQGQYLGKHQKLMPTATERLVWGLGDGSLIPVFPTPIGKIGSVICWENMMPLLRMAMYGKGVEIYCAPTADTSVNWQSTVNHIAREGGCFVLSACQFCRRSDYPPPPEYTFSDDPSLSSDSIVAAGGSVIVSPSGTILAGPNFEGEGLITADLDLGEIVRAKFGFDVVGHYSRPDVLRLVVKDGNASSVSFISKE